MLSVTPESGDAAPGQPHTTVASPVATPSATPECSDVASGQPHATVAGLSALSMLSAAAVDDWCEQSSPAFDLRAWLAQSCLEVYCNKVVEWGYDKLLFLQDTTQANIVTMVEHADVAMRPGHHNTFIAVWERLLHQYPWPAIEATAGRPITNVTGSIAAGRPTATVDDQEGLRGTLHQLPMVDGAALLDTGRMAAVAALDVEVAPMEVTGGPAVEGVGRPVHTVAAVPRPALESSAAVAAPAVVPARVPAAAAATPVSAPERAHEGPVNDTQETHA